MCQFLKVISLNAHAGQMLPADKKSPIIRSPLGDSRWLNVEGHKAEVQLVREEIACLQSCLSGFLHDWPQVQTENGWRDASVFIISPFRIVAAEGRETLLRLKIDKDRASSGTIHAFQGKEADIVFLVLGSAPGKTGWWSRQWASRKPNILNVAVTRSRSLLYVIGNVRDWKQHDYFNVLAEEIPCEGKRHGNPML